MEYAILESPSAKELVEGINNMISEGWVPQGGVSVTQSAYYSEDHKGYSLDNLSQVFAQAMVRYIPEFTLCPCS